MKLTIIHTTAAVIVLALIGFGVFLKMTDNAKIQDLQSQIKSSSAPVDKTTVSAPNSSVPSSEGFTAEKFQAMAGSSGSIDITRASHVYFLKKIGNDLFFYVTPDGLGGYILYNGEWPTFKFDGTKFSKIADDVADVSSSQKYFVFSDYTKKEIYIANMSDKKVVNTFKVDPKYGNFGEIVFSPDETKIAYAASLGEPDNEQGDVFIINIATGEQTKAKSFPDAAAHFVGWKDNSTLSY